jgi:hypothetical protein
MNLVSSSLNNHVSVATIYDLESELLKIPGWNRKKAMFSWIPEIILKRMSVILKNIHLNESYFAVILDIGTFHKRVFPYLLFNVVEKAVYLFDVWEPIYPEIRRILEKYNFNLIFISAQNSAEYFAGILNNKKVFWIPEGITSEHYYYEDFEKKTIDVMQMGRKFNLYHDRLLNYCKLSDLNYLYEKEIGKVIFKSRQLFIEALAKTKISVCFPSSVTHPERSGGVSTITQRYLQSMISKCIIVGESPSEMKEIFSYDPVIKADLKFPGEQIRDILNNYKDYIPLLQRNYDEVNQNHHWRNRAQRIAEIIEINKGKS